MRKTHPEKVALINLVRTWRKRVGLPVRDLVSQMNRHLNQRGFTQEILTEHSFRILFTDHPERDPRVSPERVVALLTVIRKYRTDIPGCTAEEALQLAELTKFPVHLVSAIKRLFPSSEFDAAWRRFEGQPSGFDDPPPVGLTSWPLPHNLPPRVRDFVGREAEIAQVLAALQGRWPMITIEGASGRGKTSLAAEVTRRWLMASPSPRQAIWLKATDRTGERTWIDWALDRIATESEHMHLTELDTVQKMERVTQLLSRSAVLLVLDNYDVVNDDDLQTWLCALPEPVKVLLTSITASMRRVWPITLTGLETNHTLELIRRYCDRFHIQIELDPDLLRRLAYLTQGNPKATKMILGYLKYESGAELASVVADLEEGTPDEDSLFQRLFERIWEALGSDRDSPVQRLLLALPFFVDSMRPEALFFLADLPDDTAEVGLGKLLELQLLDVDRSATTEPVYSTHTRVRTFALEKLRQEPDRQHHLRRRWVVYFSGFVASKSIPDTNNPLPFQQINKQWNNLTSVMDWLYREQNPDLVNLILPMEEFIYIGGYWGQMRLFLGQALELAQTDAHVLRLHCILGRILALQDRFEEAAHSFDLAQQLTQRDTQPEWLYRYYDGVTNLWQRRREFRLFHSHLSSWQNAVAALAEPVERERQTINLLFRQAGILLDEGETRAAQSLFEEQVSRSRRIQWERATAYGLNYLGDLATAYNDLVSARAILNEGWSLAQRWQDRRRIAYYWLSFARLERQENRLDNALESVGKAYNLFQKLGMHHEETETLSLIHLWTGE